MKYFKRILAAIVLFPIAVPFLLFVGIALLLVWAVAELGDWLL